MTEQEARERIIAWAKEHFEGKTQPDVEVVSIYYEPEYDVWNAQLSVSSSEDDPYVTFIEDSMYKHGVQVNNVESNVEMSENNLVSQAMAAYTRTETAYKDAIEARDHLDIVVTSIPLNQPDLYKQAQAVQESAVQAVNAAWHAKYAAEKLLEDIGKLYES